MKAGRTALLLAGAVLLSASPASSEPTRLDAIWARSTNGAPITLNGVLDEPAWAAAESKLVRFGVDNGIAGSGWKIEAGRLPKDSTNAILKFLVVGNKLYLGAVLADSSVGGSSDFNRFDGLLMSIKDHTSLGHPAPPAEYLYSWWYQPDVDTGLPVVPDPTAPGLAPTFGGRWADPPWGSPRTPEQIEAWNAVTVVNGLTNSDVAVDIGYTVEMCFDLGVMGYDVTQAEGDIVEWNVSVYDCDWFWPLQGARFSSNRAWWQSPWGNVAWYNEVRIHARPDVTISSGPVPAIGPEVRIPNGTGVATPTIDGLLTEQVWSQAPGFDIKYGDDPTRESYGNPLKWRAGQFQPEVNGGIAAVLDPGDATVKWFFKGDILYLGFDVRDQFVQSHPLFDRWDAFIVTINDRAVRYRDQNLESRRLTFRLGTAGEAIAEDYLPFLRDTVFGAQLGLALKPGTTVDTTGLDFDTGYTAELSVDLTKIGYPAGLGDGAIFIGIDMLDGDSFTPFTDSYGTRTWWGREYEHECCPAAGFLDPSLLVTTAVGDPPTPLRFALLGNHPNPFTDRTTIRYRMAGSGRVTLDVYDLQGRKVVSRALGLVGPGERTVAFDRAGLQSGIYLYRLDIVDPISGERRADLSGKMMYLK